MVLSRLPIGIGKLLGNGRFANITNKLLLNNISRVGTLSTLACRVPARLINKYLIKGKLRMGGAPYNKEYFDKRNALLWEAFKDPSTDPWRPLNTKNVS